MGVSDCDVVLFMCGFCVFVCWEDFLVLVVDEFYWVDLIGFEVVNE